MVISHTHGRGKKIHIFIDGEYCVTSNESFWNDNYIKDGTDISEDEYKELLCKINYSKAVDKCYDLLSRRDHSVRELKMKLLRTVDEFSANKAIDKMLQLGYLDDEKYAHTLLKYLLESKNMSEFHIKQEMYKRGLSGDIISRVLDESEIDNVSSCAETIRKKYLNKLHADGGREKVTASLMKKGFSYYDIQHALEKIENEE